MVIIQKFSLLYRHAEHASSLTVESCYHLPSPTFTWSKWAHRCNSHFIHGAQIEVSDGVWGSIGAHQASREKNVSFSSILHRVASDLLTSSQCWSAPGNLDIAWFIQGHHRYTGIRRSRYIYIVNDVQGRNVIRLYNDHSMYKCHNYTIYVLKVH